MSDFTKKVSDKVTAQYEQLSGNLEKVAKAGKGLYLRLRDEGTKQFNDLVATGEKAEESEESIIEQVKSTITEQLGDVKGTAQKARLATLGLATKVRKNGGKVFQELVEAAEETPKSSNANKTSHKAKTKTSSKAA